MNSEIKYHATRKIVRVTYTVQESYVEQNKQNIGQVMEALGERGYPGIRYNVYLVGAGGLFP